MFRKIADLISGRRQREQELPLGLTPAEINHLKVLRNCEEWPAYINALDNALKLNSDALLASRDAYNDTYYKGVIAGLRKAGTLIDELILKEQQIARHNQRAAKRAEPDAAARTTALYGTAAWGVRSESKDSG